MHCDVNVLVQGVQIPSCSQQLSPLRQVISPRNHMVFTPLLASTCVGTLEPRSVALPLTDIQPQLKQPQVRPADIFN